MKDQHPQFDSALREAFDRYISENNLRHTPERYKILEEIKSLNRHFEADDLVMQLRQKQIRVSRATVYRTLGLLVEIGFVRKFRFDENHYHYELVREEETAHGHLVCTQCGSILEFHDDTLEEVQELICAEHQFQPVRRTVEIYGVCPECQKKSAIDREK